MALDLGFHDGLGGVSIAAPARPARQARGQTAYLSGLAAEDCVARHLEGRGLTILARRWRGQAGEIDLICLEGDTVVFLEVKHARQFETALARVRPAQVQRVFAAVEEFMGTQHSLGLTDLRVDLALVDGKGAVEIVGNAFAWM